MFEELKVLAEQEQALDKDGNLRYDLSKQEIWSKLTKQDQALLNDPILTQVRNNYNILRNKTKKTTTYCGFLYLAES